MATLKNIQKYPSNRRRPPSKLPTRVQRLLYVVFFLALINPIASVQAGKSWQSIPVEQQAQEILNRLTPEERVGQLILVTYQVWTWVRTPRSMT
jgi:hypothetical protein